VSSDGQQAITLRDFVDDRWVYILERATGQIEHSKATLSTSIAGYARMYPGSPLGSAATLLAIYCADQHLWLRLGADQYDLLDTRVEVRAVTAIPFVRQLTILQEGSRVGHFRTRAKLAELQSWPSSDMIRYIVSVASSREERLRTFLRWSAVAAGEDITSLAVQAELRIRLERLMAQDQHSEHP
jgi:hypothetical protein